MRKSRPLTFILTLGVAMLPWSPGAATARIYESEDFAIRLKAPAGQVVCPALSWQHVHGFGYDVSPPWNCERDSGWKHVSFVGIWAAYNVVPWSFRKFKKLTCKGQQIALPTDQLARLAFKGRKTAYCAVKDKGEISVHAMTEQGYDRDFHASCIQYDAYLFTRAGRLTKDLSAFATFMKNLTISKFAC